MVIRNRWIVYAELALLFFFHGMAMGMWFVPLSTVLDAYGLGRIKAYAFAASALAAFISPLLFGAMADQHLGAVRVLRWVALCAAGSVSLATFGIEQHLNPWLVLGLIQFFVLFATPTWSIVTAVVLSGLSEPQREFGRVRALGTLGWMAGCWLVSALGADTTTVAGHASAVAWLVVAAFTFFIPQSTPPKSTVRLTLSQRFGLDALALLRHPDHRAVFLTSALVTVPLAAFYVFTPPHLRSLGLEKTSAWMTLGQVTEIIAMVSLSSLLLNWRLKSIFAAGLACALLRYIFCAFDTKFWVLAGVSLHGFAFTLFFVTAPIYLDGQVDSKWRARAQALMTLMNTGVGNLVGYLSCGWWFNACSSPAAPRWNLFWGGLALAVAAVFAYFLRTYHSKDPRPQSA